MPKLPRPFAGTRAVTCPAALVGALALFGIAGCTEPQRQAQQLFDAAEDFVADVFGHLARPLPQM